MAPGGSVQARILAYTGGEYRVAYQAARPALLRIAVPYFPGWRAEVEGRSVPVLPVDLALSGVVVPAGSHELLFRYQSTWFRTGALISAISWLGVALWFAWPLVGRFRAALAASPLPFRVRTRAAFTNSAAESPSPSRNARPG